MSSRDKGIIRGESFMNCAEFQKVLPYIIESGGSVEEEAHLQSCRVCADLVADLRYIAEQAKLLVPMEDPSPRVWDGIRESLEHEGLVKGSRARGRLLGTRGVVPWLLSAAAVALVIFGLVLYRGNLNRQSENNPETASQALPSQADDQQILSQVSAHNPEMLATYQVNLQSVNMSIDDARKSVQQDPDDDDARQSLIMAYEQKAMLYDMATRSLQ